MKRITANQYQTSERYYKLPKILFEDEKYMDMKLEVKVAYSILKDRLELSLSRGWIDEEGAVYLVFSNSNLMKLLGCSKSKLLSIKKILKEYDLIDEVQQDVYKRQVLLGLYPADKGSIDLYRNGRSPRNLEQWRSWIAYVPQKVELFKGAIRSNLTLGFNQEVSDQQLWQALEIAQAKDRCV